MVANPKLKSSPFKAENTDVSILVPEHKESTGAGLAVLEASLPQESHEWLNRVKRVVEEALTRQSRRMMERESVIREQSEMLSKVTVELRHQQEMASKEREVFEESSRRMTATNQNMRSALEERDRKLVVFAKKVSSLRKEKDGRSKARKELLAELKGLRWYQRKERQALLTALEALS